MPKNYYRCPKCYKKVYFSCKYVIDNPPKYISCDNCDTRIRYYKSLHNYWWELFYITIRDLIRKLKGRK